MICPASPQWWQVLAKSTGHWRDQWLELPQTLQSPFPAPLELGAAPRGAAAVEVGEVVAPERGCGGGRRRGAGAASPRAGRFRPFSHPPRRDDRPPGPRGRRVRVAALCLAVRRALPGPGTGDPSKRATRSLATLAGAQSAGITVPHTPSRPAKRPPVTQTRSPQAPGRAARHSHHQASASAKAPASAASPSRPSRDMVMVISPAPAHAIPPLSTTGSDTVVSLPVRVRLPPVPACTLGKLPSERASSSSSAGSTSRHLMTRCSCASAPPPHRDRRPICRGKPAGG